MANPEYENYKPYESVMDIRSDQLFIRKDGSSAVAEIITGLDAVNNLVRIGIVDLWIDLEELFKSYLYFDHSPVGMLVKKEK